MTRIARAGYRIAQAGGVLMFVGGLVDVGTRALMPHHVLALSAVGAPTDEAQQLVLGLLHALGGALLAAGVAVLGLLWAARRTDSRRLLAVAAVVAVLAEGPNAAGLAATGSLLFIAPLSFLLLVVVGCALQLFGVPRTTAAPEQESVTAGPL